MSGQIPRSEDGHNFLCGSLLNDVAYVFEVDDDMLAKSVWNEGECPPCSPKKAKTLAKSWINKNADVADTKDFEWQCNMIRLVPDHEGSNVWFWVVEFEYRIKLGQSTGIPARFSVAVLSDGTIPKVKRKMPLPRD